MFRVSVIAPNATMVVCRILFGGIHPVCCLYAGPVKNGFI